MKPLLFLLGLVIGICATWYIATIVFLDPREWKNDCEQYAEAVITAELIMDKISVSLGEELNATRRAVGQLCVVKGKLPPSLSSSTMYIPDWRWTKEDGWMFSTDDFPLTYQPFDMSSHR